jgi:peptidyl-prolyl cis-trans isomerase A (cyclophilin A)
MRSIGFALFLAIAGCGAESEEAPSDRAGPGNALFDPSLATEQAPATFRARFTTTDGDFVIEATRAWSPAGVDRLYNLVRMGYFHDTPFYRIDRGFVAQFGFHWQKRVNAAWNTAFIPPENAKVSNDRRTLTFAQRDPATRSVQFFINLRDNPNLDSKFPPIARVVEGMDVVDRLYSGYGSAPEQKRIANEGITYLQKEFPHLDYIKSAKILD